jgi:hypothetical protein
MDEVLKALSAIIQAASIAVTAFFAIKSLNAWRSQLVGKRRFEVAEETIVAAYKARDALNWIRNPATWSNEKVDREPDPSETEGQKRLRDSYFVHLKRIKDTADDFAQLGKVRHLSKIYLGDDTATAIDTFFEIRNEVAIAANMLIDHVGEPPGNSEDFYKEQKWVIWGTGGKLDLIKPKIEAALKTLETSCDKYLQPPS